MARYWPSQAWRLLSLLTRVAVRPSGSLRGSGSPLSFRSAQTGSDWRTSCSVLASSGAAERADEAARKTVHSSAIRFTPGVNEENRGGCSRSAVYPSRGRVEGLGAKDLPWRG